MVKNKKINSINLCLWISIIFLCIMMLVMLFAVKRNSQIEFNPEIHTCLDYGCGYINPFGSPSIRFTVNQIRGNFDYPSNLISCPKYDGQYCSGDVCHNASLIIEKCVDWDLKENVINFSGVPTRINDFIIKSCEYAPFEYNSENESYIYMEYCDQIPTNRIKQYLNKYYSSNLNFDSLCEVEYFRGSFITRTLEKELRDYWYETKEECLKEEKLCNESEYCFTKKYAWSNGAAKYSWFSESLENVDVKYIGYPAHRLNITDPFEAEEYMNGNYRLYSFIRSTHP